VKPFVLPLLLWHGSRRAVVAASSAVVVTLAAWAVIGFRGLLGYPHLLARLTEAQGTHGASLYALLNQLGSSTRVAALTAVAAAFVVLILGRGTFNAAVLASLLFAPITWSFYFALLYVVVATQSPRFSGRWLIGLCYTPFAFAGHAETTHPLWMLLLAVAGAVYVCSVKPEQARRARRRTVGLTLSMLEHWRLSRTQQSARPQPVTKG
jgi:hypothetical protein